jgi:membrane protein DedA with SNARE-associated domain
VVDDVLVNIGASPWALPVLFALVALDAFLVVVPGETAVTAFAALGVTSGSPPLAAVVAVAAAAAFLGDAVCYLIGRRVGLERWRWMRGPRALAAFTWARRRLDRSTAAIVFTARFIPFARLAVNLTAGASRVPAPRYLAVAAVAATGWAAYQSFVGAIVAWIIPGSTVAAVLVSIAVALALGVALDALLARRVTTREGRDAGA